MGTRRAAVGITFAALLLGLMPTQTFAGSASAQQSRPRPDAAIRYAGATSAWGDVVAQGRWVGLHIRNRDAQNQTITRRFAGAAPRGTHYLFELKLTNRGAAGRLAVMAPGESAWRVHYFAGAEDVTIAVDAGTFRTPRLAHGESYVVRISARLGTPGTALVQRLVVAGAGLNSARDSVRLNLRYLSCGC
jgi:hypothetical protein